MANRSLRRDAKRGDGKQISRRGGTPSVFQHVGLLVNEPAGGTSLLFNPSSGEFETQRGKLSRFNQIASMKATRLAGSSGDNPCERSGGAGFATHGLRQSCGDSGRLRPSGRRESSPVKKNVPGYTLGVHRRKSLRLEGFEPPTDGLEIRCSIQLSYRRVLVFAGFSRVSPVGQDLIHVRYTRLA